MRTNTSEKLIDEGVGIEAGEREIRQIELQYAHPLVQIRSKYNTEEIDELATSMIATDKNTGKYRIFVMYPPWVATFTSKEAAQEYLSDASTYYEEDLEQPYDIETFSPDRFGNYHFIINGHRRYLAIHRAIEMLEADYDADELHSDLHFGAINYPQEFEVKVNKPFIEANLYQTVENIHVRPPARDDARDIERFYKFYQKKYGVELGATQIAKRKQLSRTKVADALNYAKLPDLIKKSEASGWMSYGVAVAIGELQAIYKRVAKNNLEQGFGSPEEQAEHYIISFFGKISAESTRRKGRFSNREKIKFIKDAKEGARMQLIHVGDFFAEEDVSFSAAERAYSKEQLIKEMINSAGVVAGLGLSPEELSEIRDRVFEKFVEQELTKE